MREGWTRKGVAYVNEARGIIATPLATGGWNVEIDTTHGTYEGEIVPGFDPERVMREMEKAQDYVNASPADRDKMEGVSRMEMPL